MSNDSDDVSSSVPQREEVLGVLRQGRRGSWIRRWLVGGALLGVIVAALYAWRSQAAEPHALQFTSVPVRRGSIEETVTATGTLSPVGAVELGAEVTGKLTKVAVDVNDAVKEGQVLAEIDPDQLSARVEEARAQLQSALANHTSAKASLDEAEVKERRVGALFGRQLASAEELETAHATTARAAASVAAASAQITVARASLASAETALSRAIIVAPISGVVLARNVEPGQTVTAGFQTPVLFTLARDLNQLELNVEVDEADIGKVHEGQMATFSVDAYPEKRFESRLVKLHNLPTSTEGSSAVVTYAAVLTVQNQERLLRPGMTATATITTRTIKDALLVPNGALRFEPPPRSGNGRPSFFPFPGFGRRRPPRPEGGAAEVDSTADRVYIKQGAVPRPVAVHVVGSDGINSAVTPRQGPDALPVGAELILGVMGESQ
jgi:HlyD family secretion protein